MWLNVVFHISLAVFLHKYELKRSRGLSVTRIHSHTCLLPVKMGRKEKSLTFLLFAAAYFSSMSLEVNAPFFLWVFVRLLVLLLFLHTSYFLYCIKYCHLKCTLQICPAFCIFSHGFELLATVFFSLGEVFSLNTQ